MVITYIDYTWIGNDYKLHTLLPSLIPHPSLLPQCGTI